MLTQRSKLPVLAPFLSLVACYCNLLGQVWQLPPELHISGIPAVLHLPLCTGSKRLKQLRCCMQHSVSCRQHVLHACLLAGAPAFVI